jgi:hypothetical protein
MDTCSQKDAFLFVFCVFFCLATRGYSNERAVNASDCFTQTGYLKIIAPSGVDFNLVKIVLKIAKGVRLEVAEENSIFVVLKCVRERCCKVVARKAARISANLILKVGNVSASSMPAYLFFFGLLVGVDGNFHAIVEHSVILVVVHNVEFDAIALASILNAEVKPLSMTLCVDVVLHQAIVFKVRYFLS